MVKTSLINLVNLRIRDLPLWFNGRKFLKADNEELLKQKRKKILKYLIVSN